MKFLPLQVLPQAKSVVSIIEKIYILISFYKINIISNVRLSLLYKTRFLANLIMGDSTLRTLHSDTKINILNPNLNDKMFNKGVQTNIENTFSVPFPPSEKML